MLIGRSLLVLPRLYLGIIFAIAVYGKLTAPPGFARILTGFLSQGAMQNGFGWYQHVVGAVILPNVHVFAVLVIAGELYVAIAMLLGVTTRAAAVVAIFLLLNYFSAKGMLPWMPASNDGADIVLSIVVMAGAAGRSFGFDRALHERFPRVPLF